LRKKEKAMNKELWDKGLAVRKEVLGNEYVERNLKAADDFNMPMQELVTESCWGWLWARPNLPRKTRSIVNLAMLSALNRGHEFKVHVRGALVNGVTREEIREILLQVAVYCGMPAGVEAFRLAREAIKEYDQEKR
jgi:4-carboxymuconolactone decarboxylase